MRNRILAALGILCLLLTATDQARAEKGNLPPLPDTKVTIPWGDFLDFFEGHAPPPAPSPPPPPTDVTVGRAAWTARLSSGRLEASTALDVTTYGEGWHEIFIAGRDTPLVSLTVDGKEAVTLIRDDGVWVSVPGEGKKTIRATIVADAPDTPGPHSVTIPDPHAAVRVIDLSYPSRFTDVGVNGVVVASVPGRITAVLRGSAAIEVSYTVASPEVKSPDKKRPSGPAEVSADVFFVMDIREEAVFLSVRVDYSVAKTPTRSFRVKLPKGFDLVDVKGEGISSWTVSEDNTELSVTVGYDVAGTYTLLFSLENDKTEGIGTLVFPKVIPVGAKRTTGYLTIVSGGGFEVTEAASSLLSVRDPSELPDAVLSLSPHPPILAFRFTDPAFSLTVGVRKGEDLSALSAFVDSANSVILVTADGKTVVRTSYYIRNRSLQFLRISLPEQAVFWSATVRGLPAKSSTDEGGVVMIPLPMGTDFTAQPFVVSVVIFVPTDPTGWAGRLRLALPRLDIPTGEMMATFYLPERASYLCLGGDMEQIEYFAELLSPGSSESFVEENLRLRKAVYERQEDLENVINEQQQMPDKGGTVLPPAPEGFNLPLSGKVFRFVKLITMGEETSIVVTYVDRRLLVMGGLLLLAAVGGGALRYRRKILSAITGRTGGNGTG